MIMADSRRTIVEFEAELQALEATTNPLFAEVRRRNRVLFQNFYPKLSNEQIAAALTQASSRFDDFDILVIQTFYRTISYAKTVEELKKETGQGGVRMRVQRALEKLPEESQLHVALTMAVKNLNILNELSG